MPSHLLRQKENVFERSSRKKEKEREGNRGDCYRIKTCEMCAPGQCTSIDLFIYLVVDLTDRYRYLDSPSMYVYPSVYVSGYLYLSLWIYAFLSLISLSIYIPGGLERRALLNSRRGFCFVLFCKVSSHLHGSRKVLLQTFRRRSHTSLS